MFFNFVYNPLFNHGDAIIYSRAADWRIGDDVRREIIAKHNSLSLQQLAMALEPHDLRKGYTITSAGQAHFYGPKKNNCFQLKYSCDYATHWKSGMRGLIQYKPNRITIGECQRAEVSIPF